MVLAWNVAPKLRLTYTSPLKQRIRLKFNSINDEFTTKASIAQTTRHCTEPCCNMISDRTACKCTSPQHCAKSCCACTWPCETRWRTRIKKLKLKIEASIIVYRMVLNERRLSTTQMFFSGSLQWRCWQNPLLSITWRLDWKTQLLRLRPYCHVTLRPLPLSGHFPKSEKSWTKICCWYENFSRV